MSSFRELAEASSSPLTRPATRRAGLLAFALLACCLGSAFPARGVLLFQTGFETAEGYDTKLDLAGQKGWAAFGSGGNGLLPGVFPGKGNQAYVGFTPPHAGDSNLFLYQPINQAVSQAQFSVLMSVQDSTTANNNFDDFYWSVYNRDGTWLFGIDFDNFNQVINYYLDGTNELKFTGLGFTSAVPATLTINLDFASNRWSATFDGRTLATNQPITTVGSKLDLGDVDASWIIYNPAHPGDNYLVFDDYTITGSVPAPRLSWLGVAGGSPALRLSGKPDLNFAVESSTNLANWVPLKTNVTAGGTFDYVDTAAAGRPSRFYRARWVP